MKDIILSFNFFICQNFSFYKYVACIIEDTYKLLTELSPASESNIDFGRGVPTDYGVGGSCFIVSLKILTPLSFFSYFCFWWVLSG